MKVEPIHSEADVVNAARLELLSQKPIGGGFSLEEKKRLQELSNRVRELIPRLTEDHYFKLEKIMLDVDRTRRANEKRRSRLGRKIE